MRVLMVIATYLPVLGGTQRQCRLLAERLARRGVEVTVLTRSAPGTPRSERTNGFRIRRLAVPGSGRLASLLFTLVGAALLRAGGKHDLIQCYQLLSPSLIGILGTRRGGPPVLARLACSGPDGDVAEARRLPLGGLRPRLLRRLDALVTLNAEMEAELRAYGLGHIPTHRIPIGVDLDTYHPADATERTAMRRRLGLEEDRAIAIYAGRLVAQKRVDVLLQAWAALPARHRLQPLLLVLGDGPQAAELAGLAGGLGIGGRVRFLGAVDEVAPFLWAADLFVLPSRSEGMPNGLLEAMACGLPVVASDVAGTRDLLGDEEGGRLVPPGNADALTAALETVAGCPGLRWKLGRAARERAMAFDIGVIADRYLDLYRSLEVGR